MILIGEKFNSSIPKTLELYKNKNEQSIINLINAQSEADFLDINTGLCQNETEMMNYMIDLVKSNSNSKIMLDSSNSTVLLDCAKKVQGEFAINSITAKERLIELLPVIKEYNCSVIALPIEDTVPKTAKERLENAKKIIDVFDSNNMSVEKVYFDILTEPVSTNQESALVSFETLKLFKDGGLKTVCGLSNVSFGLPKRRQINAYYLSLLMGLGLDGAICDVTDPVIVSAVKTTDMLLGNDEFCMEYVMEYK